MQGIYLLIFKEIQKLVHLILRSCEAINNLFAK